MLSDFEKDKLDPELLKTLRENKFHVVDKSSRDDAHGIAVITTESYALTHDNNIFQQIHTVVFDEKNKSSTEKEIILKRDAAGLPEGRAIAVLDHQCNSTGLFKNDTFKDNILTEDESREAMAFYYRACHVIDQARKTFEENQLSTLQPAPPEEPPIKSAEIRPFWKRIFGS